MDTLIGKLITVPQKFTTPAGHQAASCKIKEKTKKSQRGYNQFGEIWQVTMWGNERDELLNLKINDEVVFVGEIKNSDRNYFTAYSLIMD